MTFLVLECAHNIIVFYLQVETKKMDHEIEDLPHGPLDIYRKKASFNWKDMIRFLDGDEIYALRVVFQTNWK